MSDENRKVEPVELEFIANDVLENYLGPDFDLKSDFEILSTIRYDPLLEESLRDEYYSDDDIQADEHNVPNTEYSISETNDLISLDNSRKIPSSQFFLFDEHLHRIKLALNYFKWDFQITKNLLLLKLNDALQFIDQNIPYKCRVLINRSGELKIEVVPVPIIANMLEGLFDNIPLENVWSVYIDSSPIPISPFTSFKTTKRDHYSEARNRSLPPGSTKSEVLVYNTAEQVTEGSITNVAFKRSKIYPNTGKIVERWVTPPLSSGCLCGVTRHMLVSKGLVEVEPIRLSDVVHGEEVLLFNGIMGVVKGEIK